MDNGKLMNIDIEKFKERFNREYQFLYDNHDRVAGYGEALEAMEEFIANHGDFVGEFARYRGDYITSDREMVAFMFALNQMTGDDDDQNGCKSFVPYVIGITESQCSCFDSFCERFDCNTCPYIEAIKSGDIDCKELYEKRKKKDGGKE